ncbi:MAG: hypothetical protein ACTSR6_03990 [Candidatus Heimdallarchaeota archaeon]
MSKQTKRVKEAVIEKHIEETVEDSVKWEKVSLADILAESEKAKAIRTKELAKDGLIEINIGIDCRPCTPRPDTYLLGVLEGTGIAVDPTKTNSRLFGAWNWTITIKKELWTNDLYDMVFARLLILYNTGKIRGGKLSKPEIEEIIKFIIWENNDPRILGDNYSKVNKIVSFIGSEEEALKHYKQMKNALKFAGTNCTSFSYPSELKESEVDYELGQEIIIHAEKHEPDDDDFAEQNADSYLNDQDYYPDR